MATANDIAIANATATAPTTTTCTLSKPPHRDYYYLLLPSLLLPLLQVVKVFNHALIMVASWNTGTSKSSKPCVVYHRKNHFSFLVATIFGLNPSPALSRTSTTAMPQFGRFHQLRKFLEVDRTVAWAGMKSKRRLQLRCRGKDMIRRCPSCCRETRLSPINLKHQQSQTTIATKFLMDHLNYLKYPSRLKRTGLWSGKTIHWVSLSALTV